MVEVNVNRKWVKVKLLFLLLVVYLGWRLWPVSPVVLELSEETTWVTEPLKANGTPDYDAVLNAKYGKGVTRENNAAVLLLEKLADETTEDQLYILLDVDIPERRPNFKHENIFSVVEAYCKSKAIDRDERRDIHKRLNKQGWTASEFPELAKWLKTQEAFMGAYIEASKMPHYFVPFFEASRVKSYEMLLPIKTVTESLLARVTLDMGEGRIDAALDGVITVMRMGRLVGTGGKIIQALVGYGFEGRAITVLEQLINEVSLNQAQVIKLLDAVKQLPEYISDDDLLEGVAYEIVGMMIDKWKGEKIEFDQYAGLQIKDFNVEVDINVALREFNRTYREYNKLFEIKNVSKMLEALDEFGELQKKAFPEQEPGIFGLKETKIPLTNGQAMYTLFVRGGKRCYVSSNVGKISSLNIRQLSKVKLQFVRLKSGRELVLTGVALSGYYDQHGKFPESLDELRPGYFSHVPVDVWSGKPLVYRKTDTGCVVYSVGENGTDDGGVISERNRLDEGDRVIKLERK